MVELNSLAGKKKWFVGVVTDSNEINNKLIYEVKFLLKKQKFFVFPQLDDTSTVDSTEIKSVLIHPTINNRGHHIFDDTLDLSKIE